MIGEYNNTITGKCDPDTQSDWKIYCNVVKTMSYTSHVGMVTIRPIKMVMTGGWFMTLFLPTLPSGKRLKFANWKITILKVGKSKINLWAMASANCQPLPEGNPSAQGAWILPRNLVMVRSGKSIVVGIVK